MPEHQANRRNGGNISAQSVARLASQVAEDVLAHPENHQEASPELIQAIEGVIGLLQQRAPEGSELAKTVDLAKAAIASKKAGGE